MDEGQCAYEVAAHIFGVIHAHRPQHWTQTSPLVKRLVGAYFTDQTGRTHVPLISKL